MQPSGHGTSSMADIVSGLFVAWTPLAIITAVISGLGLGIVAAWMHVDPRRFVFMAVLIGVLWMMPQAVRIYIDPQATIDPIRQLGVLLLYLIPFIGPAWLIAWRRYHAR